MQPLDADRQEKLCPTLIAY